jgi:anti-sigma B factor antagonist
MSPTQTGYYEVAAGKNAVYIRVHGLASMSNCLCLRTFVEQMLDSGSNLVVVDLADCAGMDSTFMGVLAGVATYEQHGQNPRLAAVNVKDPILKLLQNVGLTELLFVDTEHMGSPNLDFVRLDEQRGEEERIALVRSAHQNLMKLSDKNEETFRPYVELLEMEMKQRGMPT